jgi:hypothetical protein
MAASQNQGFKNEDQVVPSRYPGAPKNGYTAEYDVEAGWSLISPHPSQIKSCTAAKESRARVMFGDAMRNFDRQIDFETFISDWRQQGQVKALRKYVHIVWSNATWRKLFGAAKRKDIQAFIKRIKAVPLGAPSALVAAIHADIKAYCTACKMIVRLEAKISKSDGQRRLQMSCMLEHLIAVAHTDKAMTVLRHDPADCLALGLPIAMDSPPRARKAAPKAELASGDALLACV